MHTCSSPPNSNSGDASRVTGAANSDLTTNVIWTQEDKTALINFLIAHKSEAGDELNFKQSVWTVAVAHLQPITTKGGPKNGDKCKTKWGRLRSIYQVVSHLKNLSGLSWDDTKGLNIDITTNNTWTEYVKKHADAAPFKRKGFFHYNHMAPLMPNYIHGTHAFCASQQSFGAVANQAFATGSNMATPQDTGTGLVGSNSSDDEQGAPLIPQSTPQHPPTSISSTSFASHQSKHEYSAFDDGDSMSIKSASLMSSENKHQCNTSTSALYSLSTKMDKMSDTFANGFTQESKAHSHPDHSPQCRAKTTKSFQRLEWGLTNEQKVAIMDLFETNMAAVDMFLAVDEDDDGL